MAAEDLVIQGANGISIHGIGLDLVKYPGLNTRSSSSSSKLYFQQSRMTSSNGNIFRVTGPLCGEFTGHR